MRSLGDRRACSLQCDHGDAPINGNQRVCVSRRSNQRCTAIEGRWRSHQRCTEIKGCVSMMHGDRRVCLSLHRDRCLSRSKGVSNDGDPFHDAIPPTAINGDRTAILTNQRASARRTKGVHCNRRVWRWKGVLTPIQGREGCALSNERGTVIPTTMHSDVLSPPIHGVRLDGAYRDWNHSRCG